MVILPLALKSLAHRGSTTWVSFIALSVGILLLLMVSNLRWQLQSSMGRIASQADLIIGGPSNPSHLVAFGLLQIGSPPPAISDKLYKKLINNPEVASAIPMAFGESHRGITVIGSNSHLFKSYNGEKAEPLEFDVGATFTAPMEAVLGATVAAERGYRVGEQLTIAAGFEPRASDEYPTVFTITGILAVTDSTLDSSIIVPLKGLYQARSSRLENPPPKWSPPETINLVLTRLRHRQALFAMENMFSTEMDMVSVAIPAKELEKLHKYTVMFGHLMLSMAVMSFFMALITVFFTVTANLNEQQEEIELLHLLGARPWQVVLLGILEPLLLILAALITGGLVYFLLMSNLPSWFPENLQNMVTSEQLLLDEFIWVLMVLILGSLLAAIPSWKTFRFCIK